MEDLTLWALERVAKMPTLSGVALRFRRPGWSAAWIRDGKRVPGLFLPTVSPTVFRDGPFRFFFFSREEERMHVHVIAAHGEAKFWLEPTVSLASSDGLQPHQLGRLQRIVEERQDEIRKAWQSHFGR
jgi:hypothetical protein